MNCKKIKIHQRRTVVREFVSWYNKASDKEVLSGRTRYRYECARMLIGVLAFFVRSDAWRVYHEQSDAIPYRTE